MCVCECYSRQAIVWEFLLESFHQSLSDIVNVVVPSKVNTSFINPSFQNITMIKDKLTLQTHSSPQ